MEDLAWRFPAEPIERAAVRFCEAIAKWRGKPELECVSPSSKACTLACAHVSPNSQYKKRAPTNTFSPGLPIESLVHSNPSTPTSYPNVNSRPTVQRGKMMLRRPSIDVYFTQPPFFRENGWGQNKRPRLSDDPRPGPSKRIHS